MKKSARPTRVFEFDVELYRSVVYLVIADSISKGVEKLPDSFCKLEDYSGAAGVSLQDGCGCFAVCLVYKHVDLDVLTHELFHVVHNMLEHIGDQFEEGHDEYGAYLIGLLMAKFSEKLRSWKVKL